LKSKKSKNRQKVFAVVAAILAAVLIIYAALHARTYFRLRNVRLIQGQIISVGVFSPLAPIALIFLSTVLPPLPLPVPLVEIATGLVFGFWEGFVLIFLGQVFSSILAFYIVRSFGKRFLSNFLNNSLFAPYQRFVDSKGASAVFIIRATMAAPFNIISYLAGLTKMSLPRFALATAIGVIPEAAIFSYLGTRLKDIHFRFWYIFLGIILLGAFGWILTFLMMKYLERNLD
jgi:uncharacterized membrane protein YdjX (TVP38/TMEM64 family)